MKGFETTNVTKFIGESAFQGTVLTSVNLTTHAASFAIGAAAFKGTKVSSFTWSPTYSTMPSYIFEGCRLENIEIPAVITEFGNGCFRDCYSLTTVTYFGHAQAPSDTFDGCSFQTVKVPDDYPYDTFGGKKADLGFSRAAKIGVGVGGSLVVIVIVIIVVLAVTGKIRCRRRSAESESEGETETVET